MKGMGINMDSKIIFFDIDGTILSHRNYHISESTKTAIKQAQANGHLAFVNTGRTIAEIEKEITDVGFDGYICGCGTYISYGDSVLLHHAIPTDTIQMLIKDFRRNEFQVVLEGTSAVYYDDQSTHPKLLKLRDSQINHNFTVDTWESSDISIDKFCIWSPTEEGYNRFYEKYKDGFDFINRGKLFSEVIPKGHSKATGIEFLIHALNIAYKDTYALGDGENDLPMLNYVEHSIAMGNSSDEIRGIVSYVTEDVDQDGVAIALKHFDII